jgi:hypothetical protein
MYSSNLPHADVKIMSKKIYLCGEVPQNNLGPSSRAKIWINAAVLIFSVLNIVRSLLTLQYE